MVKKRLFLPRTSQFIPLILSEYPDSKVGGHLGVLKTLKRVQQSFNWEGIYKDVQQYVSECVIYKTHESFALSPAGLLQPLPILERVWEDISLDFIEGLPRSHGFDVIVMMVDRLSKYGTSLG